LKKKLSVLVLLTGYPPEHAGAGKRIHNQYVRLKKNKTGIEWVVVTKCESMNTQFCHGPKSIFRVPVKKNHAFPKVFQILIEVIWATFKSQSGILNNIDAIHVIGFGYFMLPIVYFGRKRGVPIIREMVTTGDVGKKKSIGASLTRFLNKLSSVFVAISPKIKSDFHKTSFGGSKMCILRPNPVDTRKFIPPSNGMRNAAIDSINGYCPEANLSHKDIIVGMLGRIRKSKGQHLLVDAVAKLPENYNLLIVGPTFEGDIFPQTLRDRVSSNDVAHRVIIIDELWSDPSVFYNSLNVFAFSSLDEGLGNVVLEALCCGIPIACFEGVGGNDWLIKNGVNGYLSKRSVTEFASAIENASTLNITDAQLVKYKKMFSPQAIDMMLLRLLKFNENSNVHKDLYDSVNLFS